MLYPSPDPTSTRQPDIESVVAPAQPTDPIGIYLHIPFCGHICSYCDFNTYAGQGSLIPRYVAAMEREIARQGAALDGPAASTIYIGGGTPSLLTPEQIGQLVAACRASFAVTPDVEISMEANPNSFDEARAGGYLAAGVNRLSMGVQTQHRRGLRVLGRQHEAADAAGAFAAARRAGFANINVDLIFGWPGQTLDIWRDDLETLLGWPGGPARGVGPDHFSLYSLIVEPGTPMAEAVTRGVFTVPDDDASADLYEAAIDRLAAAGFIHYEVANWSRSNHHASRHNLIYWQNGDFAGIGAGAFGTLRGQRLMQHLRPLAFVEAVEQGQPPISNVESIDAATSMSETMLLGLRLLRTGVDTGAFKRRHGVSLSDAYGDVIDLAVSRHLIEPTATGVRLTHQGLMLSNDVTADFIRP
jgi:oxygen-independent coproporphyrinogen-3 oxidase